jgi:gas vesicle protein
MNENPEEIRADIEATRLRLGTNVDAVADKVTPSHIVQRQTDKVREAVFGVRDKVMGAADQVTDSAQALAEGAGESVSDVGSAIADAPHHVAIKAQGNPIAAGLIAFGAGMLLASLIPASDKEREAADALKTAAEPLTAELTDVARTVAQGLQGPAHEAVENVKTTAADAVNHVREEGQGGVEDVKERASDAKDNVQSV